MRSSGPYRRASKSGARVASRWVLARRNAGASHIAAVPFRMKTSLLVLLGLAVSGGCTGNDGGGTVPGLGTAAITTFAQIRPIGSTLRAAECGQYGGIAPRIPIVVHAPDGSNTLFETDDHGELTVDLIDGSAVTASYAASECGGQAFLTFFAVEPGDHLRFGSSDYLARDEISSMTVSWPAQTGVDHFEIIDPCGIARAAEDIDGTATSAVVGFHSECTELNPAPERGVVVVVVYAGDELPIMWGSLADFEIVDGGSLTIAAFQPVTTQTIELTGIPSSVSTAQIVASPQIGDAWTIRPFVSAHGAPVDARLTATGPWAGASDRIFINSIFEGADHGKQHRYERVPASATVTIADPILLPWIDAASITVDMASRTYGWTQTGDGAYDGATFGIGWDRRKPDSDGWDVFVWYFVAPQGATSFQVPELPAELADLGPNLADDVRAEGVVLLETSNAAGRLNGLPLWEIGNPAANLDRPDFPLATLSSP